ncbi:MAG: potassium transporter Kup [Salinisphaera sp.]|nr:potassium transporter Kup [Salinisphaera sp.]
MTDEQNRSLARGQKRKQEKENDKHESKDNDAQPLPLLCLTALGVVFGDIGTSPIYAFREALDNHGAIAVDAASIYGILSLIFWSLIIVVSVKYLLIVMRAHNDGEGGIIALVALLNPWKTDKTSGRYILMLLGLFGAALLFGDGMITPAITVLSAVEGLSVATNFFEPYLVPIAIVILIGLFSLQKRGSGAVGRLFGPVMLLWFVTIGVLGVVSIVANPAILGALNPAHAVSFFAANGFAGFLVLGSVFLVMTGAEALYADMGHFGLPPIRLAWFFLVLPALVLNYFGQGALLLAHPETQQPFYELAPAWGLYPLVVLATFAAVIASQAVISGVFSLTRQAVHLGQLPRFGIVQTSHESYGQIYIPVINWALMLATIALVVWFQSSSGLAAAYGVAVSTDMVITTILAFFVARRWGWFPTAAIFAAGLLLIVDLAFFGANLFKIPDGGWIPLVIAGIAFFIMATWRRGRELVRGHLSDDTESLEDFIAGLDDENCPRVPGTAVFMTSSHMKTPPMLLHHLRHNRVLHKQVVLLTVYTRDAPRVPAAERMECEYLDHGFFRLRLYYGFMQASNVPVALRLASEYDRLEVDLDEVTYYVGNETLIPSHEVAGMAVWRESLFAFMSRNAARATAYYHIPADRVVELGIQIEL